MTYREFTPADIIDILDAEIPNLADHFGRWDLLAFVKQYVRKLKQRGAIVHHRTNIAYMTEVSIDYIINHVADDMVEYFWDTPIRRCSHCGRLMTEGFCIESGQEYYCDDDCLHQHYTDEEFSELYADGNGESYYTEWV